MKVPSLTALLPFYRRSSTNCSYLPRCLHCRHRRGITIAATATLLLSGMVTACSPSVPKPVGTPKPTASETTATPEPTALPQWPLTALERQSGDSRPVVALKIENDPAAYPLAGLDQADNVWEQMVEGGATRFYAVFNSVLPTRAGPVRSARPMDAPIGAPLAGVVGCSGGQAAFLKRVRDSGQALFTEDNAGAAARRDRSRRMPHNLYFDAQALLDLAQSADATKRQPPGMQWSFAALGDASGPTAAKAGLPAGSVVAKFPAHKVTWSWNGSAWERSDAGAPLVSESGVRITADNVIVLRVQVVGTGTFDAAGSPVPETVLLGEGPAQVFTGGKYVSGIWRKSANPSLLELRTEQADPIVLAPGKVWVELVPVNGGSVEIS